jgi:hypothetical protein
MINIVGAGLGGLLAANMLRHREPGITEQQGHLPNNHSAVLRFRTSQIGDILGIPFKKVKLIKCAAPWKNPVADALAYSFKNMGTSRSDRSIIAGLVTEDRYIAPSDLIQRMAHRVTILYNEPFQPTMLSPVISTIPMPALMSILKYAHRPDFKYISGVNIRATISDCDAYVSVMVPDPALPFSRITITGDEMIVELPDYDLDTDSPGNLATLALDFLGMEYFRIREIKVRRQAYAKIAPIDDDVRKQFIFWATDQHGIFSLGRFATWRPHLLLDDLVNDIRLIDRWLGKTDDYGLAKHRRG